MRSYPQVLDDQGQLGAHISLLLKIKKQPSMPDMASLFGIRINIIRHV